jgi:hypothetical protein
VSDAPGWGAYVWSDTVKYLLIMQVNPAVLESLGEEEMRAVGEGHEAFMKAIQESGEFILTQALADPANTKVVRGGSSPAVTDGPFLEAKEFMGGFYLVDVENEERAVEIAKLIPDSRISGLAIEIRPVMFSAGAGL